MSGIGKTAWRGLRKVSGGGVFHQERVGKIQSSTDLNLIDDPDFPRLSFSNSDTTVEPDKDFSELFKALPPGHGIWPQKRDAGLIRNNFQSVLVGYTMPMLDGVIREVWATLIQAGGNHVICDSPHRAHIVFQVIVDRRKDPAHGDVIVHDLDKVEDIIAWHQGFSACSSVKEKLALLYDALVGTSKFELDSDE